MLLVTMSLVSSYIMVARQRQLTAYQLRAVMTAHIFDKLL
jgi:hypothetical protein